MVRGAASASASPGRLRIRARSGGAQGCRARRAPILVRMPSPCDLVILAGERSGDAYGAAILEDLRRWRPGIRCAALGGELLRAAGAEILHDHAGMALMGFTPVLRRLPEFIGLGSRLASMIAARPPLVVLSIDYPGFNLRLVRRLALLRAVGTRFVHLVAPQVWAWKPGRARRIAQSIDRLLCFFPFEPPLFARHGLAADFVGHPLADLVPASLPVAALRARLGLSSADRLLLLAPGSRRAEVAALLPVLVAAWKLVGSRLGAPGGRVIAAVSRVAELPDGLYAPAAGLPQIVGEYQTACAGAHLGVIASGTATLEAAILGLPHLIAYRGDPLSAMVARRVLLCAHIGLPNIVHGRRICPELMHDQCEPARMASRLLACWEDPRRRTMAEALGGTRALLGGGGAVARISSRIAEEIATAEAIRKGI